MSVWTATAPRQSEAALTGIYDPNGMGAMLFAVLAVAVQLDREYIREKTLEGQQAAAAKGNHGGRPKVIDEVLTFAAALRDKGVPMPEIVLKLTIKSGKNAGKNPSVASLYRALAKAGDGTAPPGEAFPFRPVPARITGPGSGTDPGLMERLQGQERPRGAGVAAGRAAAGHPVVAAEPATRGAPVA